ncbi:MAG: nucleotidyltransferase family protein [Desulfobacterales bacterium]|nr:nucleotidyltransferase family protein [Desulfobacterales bacterium]
MTTLKDMIRFIRCLSIKRPSKADHSFILNYLKKDISWDNLVALAQWWGVSGLLYSHLKAPALISFVPEKVMKRLENIYHEIAEQTRKYLWQIESLSHRLGNSGPPVMAIQGLSVADIYGDPGLRPLGDADLMVPPGSKGRFRIVLLEAGYTIPDFSYVDLYYKDGLWIDTHTHILNIDRIKSRKHLFPEDLTSLWERAVPFSEKLPIFIRPEPVDNFIALSAHALKHGYSRLIWLVDLHELLLNGLDWQELTARAGFWRQEKVVLYALILVEEFFHLSIPVKVKDDLGAKRLNRLEKHVIRLLIDGFASNHICYALWLCNIKGIKNKMEFIRESAFPGDKIMAQIFPKRSGRANRMDYVKRAGGMAALIFRALYRYLLFSIKTGSKK